MIRRELAKDPKLATESWDRFLPKFRKRHLKTSEKTAKKNEAAEAKAEARKTAGLDATAKKDKMKKKVYTPFPPPQQPRQVSCGYIINGICEHMPTNMIFVINRKVDLQLESGEYFLASREKEAKKTEKRIQKVC